MLLSLRFREGQQETEGNRDFICLRQGKQSTRMALVAAQLWHLAGG